MLDEDIDQTIEELGNLLVPVAMMKLKSHLSSLVRQIEDLRISRDKWRVKANGNTV